MNPVVADLGSFAPTAVVVVPFATMNPFGGLEDWGGLALLVRPDGAAAEDGITYALNTPAVGRHAATIDLAAAAQIGGPLAPGRYRVVVYGDPVLFEEVQGVPVATFEVTA